MEATMEVIHDRVAGLDVHKATVVACVRTMSGNKATRECRTYATTTDGLLSLLEWLSLSQCGLAAMEATGVYWVPVWKILSEGDFELLVANAAHIKSVPGRKTDMNDAMWIADLAAHGLIKASFVPDEELHELRTLMRTRKQLVREQTRHVQRIQKTLTEANIRLDSVISDVMGASGRRMIEAMIAGVRDPRKLAALADRRVKATPKELYDALHGRLTDHHRFLLQLHIGQWDSLDASIRAVDREVDARVTRLDSKARADKARFSDLTRLLASIPGVSQLSAVAILSEIGTDMGRFDTAGHLIAWAGLCPGQNESAGKRKRTRLRKGAFLPPASQTRATKSDLRRRRLDLDRHLSHAQGRNLPQPPRRGLFRPPVPRVESQAPRPTNRQARIRSDPSSKGRIEPEQESRENQWPARQFLFRSVATRRSRAGAAALPSAGWLGSR